MQFSERGEGGKLFKRDSASKILHGNMRNGLAIKPIATQVKCLKMHKLLEMIRINIIIDRT
jgi:hypothetical protein